MNALQHHLKLRIFYVSIVLISLCMSCGGERIDYRIRVDFKFNNETNAVINYSNLFQLNPGEDHIIHIDSEGPDHFDPETCCQGVLEGVQGDYSQVHFIVNETNCVSFAEGAGPTEISNFDAEVVGDRYFQYTYTITDVDLENIEPCP